MKIVELSVDEKIKLIVKMLTLSTDEDRAKIFSKINEFKAHIDKL